MDKSKLVTLKNGEIRPVMSIDDIFDIVREFIGDDVADSLKEEYCAEIKELEESADEYRLDAEFFDSRNEAYAGLIYNIQDEIDKTLTSLLNTRVELEKADKALSSIKRMCEDC